MFKIFKRNKEKTLIDDELLEIRNDGILLTDEQLMKAKNHDGDTLCDIGKKYFNNKNYPEAFVWYRKGAFRNNSDAQYNIGLLYHFGLGVPQDYQQAMEWYLKAVNNDGHSGAQFNIGVMYHHGHGVPQDYKKEMDWFLKSANKDGNKEAQSNIGYLYENGRGVPKNIHTAIEWYTKAANRGSSGAQFNLGVIYETEEEIMDLQKAVNWYKKSADNDDEEAKKGLTRLNEQGYYPIEDTKEENEKKSEPQINNNANVNNARDQRRDIAANGVGEQEQSSSTVRVDEHINKLMEEKIKRLEESFELKLALLQQDKMDKETLQQKLDAMENERLDIKVLKKELEQDKAKMEKEKDEEIKQLKDALERAKAALDGDPKNDICYDSSNEISDPDDDNASNCDTENDDKEETNDDYQNDINYDSASNDDSDDDNDDWKNDPNYDSSDNEDLKKDLNYDG